MKIEEPGKTKNNWLRKKNHFSYGRRRLGPEAHSSRWEARSMVKDEQVFRLRQLLRPSTTLKEIALQASMDPKTARKYIRLSTLPSENQRTRAWRTRTDPLAGGVWEEVVRQLQ